MLGTTKTFLDDFNLASLQELPSLSEIKDIETLEQELQFAEENLPEDNPSEDNTAADMQQATDKTDE